MPSIAIDDNQYLVYEGNSNQGHALWPTPILSIATILSKSIDQQSIPVSSYLTDATFIFREDSFDPITRIRRGRLYKTPGTRPQHWRVQPHPAYQEELHVQLSRNRGFTDKSLFGFDQWPAQRELKDQIGTTLLATGTRDAYTLWRIVDIERIFTGEDLLTLRVRNSLGVLPELNLSAIPEISRGKAIETIERLTNSAYRSGPEDIIESSRAVAQWCIGSFLADRENDPTLLQKDLGELGKLLDDKRLLNLLRQIFAQLHSRAKPNEQERYTSRPLREADAEFSLAGIGMLLRELQWVVD